MSKQLKEGRYKLPILDNAINSCSKIVFYYRLVIVFTLIILIALFVSKLSARTDFEPYKNSALILTCGSIIIGIFYTIINYEHNYYKSRSDYKLAKKTLGLNIAFEWSRPAVIEHLKILIKFKIANTKSIKNASTADFSIALDGDDAARTSFVIILNFLETVALGVDNGILDEDFTIECFGSLFKEFNNDYGFYISHRRKDSPKRWKKFTDVAERWAKLGK